MRYDKTKTKTKSCSDKKRFRDLQEAKGSMIVLRRQEGVRMRIYECEYCKGFHLSKIKG